MDWTSFEGLPFHRLQAEVDVRREVTRSVVATAVFFAVLSLTAIIICGLINHEGAIVAIETIAGSSTAL